MKSFRSFVSEVAEPKPAEEKKFKDQHEVDIVDHPVSTEFQHKGMSKPKAKRKADQEGDANYDQAYMESVEEEQLDELSKATLGSYIKKASDDQADSGYERGRNSADSDRSKKAIDKYIKRRSGINKAVKRLTKEEELSPKQKKIDINKNGKIDGHDLAMLRKKVKESLDQLDEIGDTAAGKNKLKNLIVNRTQKVVDAGASIERRPEKAAEYDKAQKRHMKTIGRAATRLAKEEVEQLDELSPNTLHSYIKKATGNLAGNSAANAAIAATQVDKPKSQKADRKDLVRNIRNRMKGITSASGRLADKANMAEELDEVSQETLRNYHGKAGADLQKKREKLDKGTLTMKDLKKGQNRVKGLNRAADKMHEAEEVDETTNSATKKPVNITGPDGKTRTVMKTTRANQTDDKGQDKIKTNESVEMLDEGFKAGILKLKDGSSVVVKDKDAKLLNQMMKDLSPRNRAEMTKVAMMDKAGFEEIVGFAREAD